MSDTHLIWFNGTGEKTADTKHLFEGLNSDQYTVVPGWGTEGFIGKSWTERGAQSAGILQEDLPSIEKDINNLNLLKNLNNKNKVIIGGFSRGAAFFVPYFLKQIIDTEKINFKKLMIVLMDPVTGTGNNKTSVSFTGNTVNTLKSIHLFTYTNKFEKLIKPLADKCEVYGIVLCPGFDGRAKSFCQDDTFLNALKHPNKKGNIKLENLYFTRIGITHAALSLWHTYKHKIIESLKFTDLDKKKLDFSILEEPVANLDESSYRSIININKMLNLDLDKLITHRIFLSLLSEQPRKFENDSANDNLFNDLDFCTNTTKLLNNFSDISYKRPEWFYILNDHESDVKKGMRKIDPDRAEQLKKLLVNWRN
ncbi:MAG: hypothetical protein WBA93_35205 [Microcoleaceae cyanobacterium]